MERVLGHNVKALLIIFLLFCDIYVRGTNQTFIVKDFYGHKEFQVNYKYKPLVKTISIYLSTNNKNVIDSIIIEKIIRIDSLAVKNDKFIFLSFVTQSGSNTGYKQLYILTVGRGKFYESLHILEMSKVLINDLYNSSVDSKVSIEENYNASIVFAPDPNTIIIHENYKGVFSNEPEKNAEWVHESFLKLEISNMVFCTAQKALPNIKCKGVLLKKDIKYFVIELKNETYVSYLNRWYLYNHEKNEINLF